jgi:hypothetical protein
VDYTDRAISISDGVLMNAAPMSLAS